ncbi:G2/mitotic-specific cyclin-B [Phlebotomus argentipes]|uniref:G2/mitotic-specific cyclin-B n=1 Tax=Phlebotomus argentipes TaxID=94469 RepID=UPI002892A540|nr:G2/mitotic-specific cyclin-B [Phlebotomus argentipes]
MATRKRTVKVDENQSEKLAVKAIGKNEVSGRVTRRAVLGELGNRVTSLTTGTKKVDLKDVKPRVDTRWKKTDVAVKAEPKKVVVKKVSAAAEKSVVKSPPKKAPLAQPESDFKEAPAKERRQQSHSSYLMSQVIDIDAEDQENVLHIPEYANDIYDYLYSLEERFPVHEAYMANHTDLKPRMRAVLMDWLNEVHCQFHLVPETYFMTVALVDRQLQLSKNLSRKTLQLVGIAALFVASKYEEVLPPSIYDLVHISDNAYTDRQVRQMEETLLRKLKFNLCRPLPIHFLRRFSKAARADEIIHCAAKYFLELATIEYSMVHVRPSLIAAAAIYLSLRLIRPSTEGVWTPTLQHYSKYSEEELQEVTKDLAKLVLEAPNSQFKSVFSKYRATKMRKIAELPEMKAGEIEEIAM